MHTLFVRTPVNQGMAHPPNLSLAYDPIPKPIDTADAAHGYFSADTETGIGRRRTLRRPAASNQEEASSKVCFHWYFGAYQSNVSKTRHWAFGCRLVGTRIRVAQPTTG